MRIAMLNPPFRYGADPNQWITVPPQGYGGIQWVMSHLVDGLVELGHEVLLLGAPGSPSRPGLAVLPVTDAASTAQVLADHPVDVVHDHSNGTMLPEHLTLPVISTHHITGAPARAANCVYVSEAQRRRAGSSAAPVIRLPVNPARSQFRRKKEDYLLFIGRVSRHKGVYEAAAFAAAVDLPLRVAGPAWEKDYFDALVTDFPHTLEYVGEVGGRERARLIACARALLALSQPVPGPFGGVWSEPGSTVVAEAAASGTPVIASDNGCLPEIVPGVGAVLGPGSGPSQGEAARVLAMLPTADDLRATALDRWGHRKIAQQYVAQYIRAVEGGSWV